jgi:GxxExxY protein
MKKINHEDHEGHEVTIDHETDPFSLRRMRAASPLSPEAERAMHATIGCAIAVHRALGPGYLESIYKKAMCVELGIRGLRYANEQSVDVIYRGIPISGQRVDLIVEGLIVVELKAVESLAAIHRAQVISYLRTTGLRGGLLAELSSAGPQGRIAENRPVNIPVVLRALRELRGSEKNQRCVQRALPPPPSGLAPRPRPPTSRYTPWHAAQASDRSPVHSATAS